MRGVQGEKNWANAFYIFTKSCDVLQVRTNFTPQEIAPTPPPPQSPTNHLSLKKIMARPLIDRPRAKLHRSIGGVLITVFVMCSSEQGNTPTPPPLCLTLPKPVVFNTLPKGIQDELSSMASLFEEQIKLGGPVSVFDLFIVVFSVIVFVLAEYYKRSQPITIHFKMCNRGKAREKSYRPIRRRKKDGDWYIYLLCFTHENSKRAYKNTKKNSFKLDKSNAVSVGTTAIKPYLSICLRGLSLAHKVLW